MGHIPLDQFDLSDEGFNFYSPAELAEIFKTRKAGDDLPVRDAQHEGEKVVAVHTNTGLKMATNAYMCAVVIKVLLQRVEQLESRVQCLELGSLGNP